MDLAERAKQRKNKRAALTELRAARSIATSKELEKEIKELEGALNSDRIVHISAKGIPEFIDCDSYMENVQSRIKSAWDAPFSERSLSAATIFSIDLNGKIKNIKIDKPSPRKDYNAINTVEWMRELPLGLKDDIDEMVANHNYDFALVDCKSLLKISNKEEKERYTDKLIQIQRISRSARAKNNWEEFLKKNPNSLEARIAIAQCFMDMNEKPQAIELLNEVLKQNPHHKQAKDLLDKLNSN